MKTFDVEVNKMRVGRWQSLGTEPQTPGLELPALWLQSYDQTTTRNATIFDTCWQVVLNASLTHPAATHLPPIHIITTLYFQDVKHLLKSFKNEIQYITSPMKLSDQPMTVTMVTQGHISVYHLISHPPTHTHTHAHTHTMTLEVHILPPKACLPLQCTAIAPSAFSATVRNRLYRHGEETHHMTNWWCHNTVRHHILGLKLCKCNYYDPSI